MNKYKVTYLIAHKTPWEREEIRIIEAKGIEEADKIAYLNAPFNLKHKFIKVRRLYKNEKVKICCRSSNTPPIFRQ